MSLSLRRAPLAAFLLMVTTAPELQAQARPEVVAGRWTGSMTLGDAEYPINLWFDGAGRTTGRYQLIGVTTDKNPLRDVAVRANRITFVMPSRPPQSFTGTINGRRMSGTVQIESSRETFRVRKVD